MDPTKIFVIFVILAIAAFVWIVSNSNSRKKYLGEEYLSKLEEAKRFLCVIDGFDDYVTWKQRDSLLDEYKPIRNFMQEAMRWV